MDSGEYVGKDDFTLSDNQSDSEDGDSESVAVGSEDEMPISEDHEEVTMTFDDCSSSCDEGDVQNYLNADNAIPTGTEAPNKGNQPNLQNPEHKKSVRFLKHMTHFILDAFSRAKYVSLLNDYVESEFFLIDGDSLFITCVTETTLCQGQHLHFFYFVERFLLDLTEKGAKYVIVFFKDAENLYFRDPSLLSLRAALILHLRHNTDTTVHTEFSNCLSPDWQIFLKESYPYFILVSDEGLNLAQTHFFYILIIHSLGKKINVVLTSGQESDVIRVYGYHLQSKYSHRSFFEKFLENIQHSCQTLVQFLQESNPKALLFQHGYLTLKDIQKEVHQTMSLLKKQWPEESDVRRILCAVTCSVILNLDTATLSSAQAVPENCSQEESNEPLTQQEVADLCRMHCLSVTLLLHLPLSQRTRARNLDYSWNKEADGFLKMQRMCLYYVLKQLDSSADWEVDLTHLPDFNDNLLWQNIVHYYERDNVTDLKLGEDIEKGYHYLWNIVSKLSNKCDAGEAFPVRSTSKPFLGKGKKAVEETHKKIPSVGLIPMRSTLVEEFAGDVLKDMPLLSSDDTAESSLVRGKDFDELVHWHSGNPLSDDYDRTQENFNAMSKDPKALRQRQKLHQYNMMYGRSLEGDIFKTIVTQGDVPSNAKSTVKYKKTTTSHKTKAQKIIEENQKSKKVKVDQQQFERWSQLSPSVMREIKENIASGTSHLDEFLKTCESDTVKFTAELAGLDACLEVWIEHCKCQDSHSRDTTIAVHVMRRFHSLLWKHKQALEKKNLDKITKCLNCFGFYNLACSLDSKQITESDKDKVSKYALEMGAARFQLQYMGHYLFRDERRDPDPRVQHFIPDTWQRELLDVVDSNESAVIVAPTSSGKTYASYYCMEKILKEGNDGIVVYVAPTKALVNQVVATVCNRFRKALPDGLTVCGVFTRDYRTDALNCQILVTVPQCLEILLLAPHRQNWVKRIKYVIFDEVHCLGGEIGAEVWEHLLVMIRCPFLALSATISNPEHLTEWMKSVKRYWQECDSTRESTESSRCTKKAAKKHKEVRPDKKSYKVRLVLHGERYNDLEKHVCSVQQGKILLDHFHPCAALTVNHIERYGFPSDLSFSPRESVQLYDTMFEIWPQWPKAQELDPERFTCFKDKAVITKADARIYEEELKKELKNWIVIGHKEKVNQLLLSLKPHPTDCSENVMEKQFPLFIEKLREMDKLPAIIFLFNVKEVEAKAISVFCYLKQKQRASQTPNTEKEKHNLMEKLNKLEKSIKKTQTLDNKLPSASKADSLVMACEEQRSLQKRLDKITEIPQDCTHANSKAVDQMTLERMMKTLWTVRNRGLLKMLAQRGIGFHYDPLQAKGRQFVEMLFRMGFMRVITSTSSLALGINMPCKSVVFASDSVELDALNYRQMSGRAGRRGQDLIGNVYFYDIPVPKVEKLMKSNVPQLKGQFPLSISLVLRLMFLASKADDKEDAKAKVVSVLKHSLLSFKRANTQEMLQLYFIFSVQFLIQEGYLDQDGNPTGFAGLVSHLHYHEPANFVLVSFLVKGLFHKLCQPIAKGSTVFSEHVMETLVLILANLFGRMPFAACFAKQKDTFEQSKVFLEDLPEDFSAAVHEYNSKIERLFGCFLRTASKQADKEQENKLPLSKISFAGKQCEDSELVSYLMNCTKERTAVSPFACLSGMVDLDLFDAKRVASAVMHTIDVKARDVPVLHLKKYDNQGRRMPLNAYALDFYKHGSLHAMTEDNRLNEGDAYELLKDFMLMVKSIRISLDELCENKNDNVLLAFQQLSESYCSKLKKY